MTGDRRDAKDFLFPSCDNIYAQIEVFVSDVKPGDKLLFVFCGHGTQVTDKDGMEEDGKDEAIVLNYSLKFQI